MIQDFIKKATVILDKLNFGLSLLIFYHVSAALSML